MLRSLFGFDVPQAVSSDAYRSKDSFSGASSLHGSVVQLYERWQKHLKSPVQLTLSSDRTSKDYPSSGEP